MAGSVTPWAGVAPVAAVTQRSHRGERVDRRPQERDPRAGLVDLAGPAAVSNLGGTQGVLARGTVLWRQSHARRKHSQGPRHTTLVVFWHEKCGPFRGLRSAVCSLRVVEAEPRQAEAEPRATPHHTPMRARTPDRHCQCERWREQHLGRRQRVRA